MDPGDFTGRLSLFVGYMERVLRIVFSFFGVFYYALEVVRMAQSLCSGEVVVSDF